jgi:ribosomal protein S18 acetylase RimI-like enzyme
MRDGDAVSSTAHAWLAGPGDAEAVATLLVAFRDHMGLDWPSENAFLASVERLMEDIDTDFLLGAAHADAPPAGVLQLRYRFSVWTAAPDAWIEDVYVAQAARRAGVGDALVARAIERAGERGARRVELDCNEDNAGALALYERHGFSARSKRSEGRDLFLGRPVEPA